MTEDESDTTEQHLLYFTYSYLFHRGEEWCSERIRAEVRGLEGMVFPVVMYGCESWTIKKAEHRKIDAFEL